MKTQVKITVALSFILLWLPFIFLQDIFPFFRFGMFAEPLRHESQSERFMVFFAKKGNKKQKFQSESILLNASHWDLLWRNAFAESQKSKGEIWEVLRLVSRNGKTDTLCVAKIDS